VKAQAAAAMSTRRTPGAGEVKARKSHKPKRQREPTEQRGEVETRRRDEQGRQSQFVDTRR